MRQHLDPSELGTREYWDEAYARELDNHTQDADDEGTIWFEDTGAEGKVLDLLEKLEDQVLLCRESGDPVSNGNNGIHKAASRILDLGTGNGHMLFELRDSGWMGELVGVDYSRTSVDLARRIAQHRCNDNDEQPSSAGDSDDKTHNAPANPLRFEEWDILTQEAGIWLGGGFDAVLDKGTFDAISLSAETDAQGRRICETYRARVIPLLKTEAFLIITSCNWTKDELLQWFVAPGEGLELFDEAKYPTFTFGGQQGQSVCTLVFRKV